ncbi:unnamed protein product, partial [Protopolystoma xenopodis]
GGSHGCQQECINTHGSYKCKCLAGFEIDHLNPKNCKPLRCFPECYPGRGRCLNGKCECFRGFTGSYCEQDIDECIRGTHDCDHICVNTLGSYRCECKQNYTLDQTSMKKCLKKECYPKCVNNQGSCNHEGFCICELGFVGISCELDINECIEGTHNCEQICTNTDGSFLCSCEPGFKISPFDSSKCLPVECHPPCVTGQGSCDNSGKCICTTGFFGPSCEISGNVCKTNRPCDQECRNLGGGQFECNCWPGFEMVSGSSTKCRKKCSPGVNCIYGTCTESAVNMSDCVCNPGYEGEKCDLDIDECEGDHGCLQICRNSPGSYSCECRPGFILEADGRMCSQEGSAIGCDGGCLNGGHCLRNYTCICLPGYRGQRCEERIDLCSEQKPCEHECYNLAVSQNFFLK